MDREQAVAELGEEAVDAVERLNCDFTNRVMDNGMVEFSASMRFGDSTLVVYYYQRAEDVAAAPELDHLAWEISHYAIY